MGFFSGLSGMFGGGGMGKPIMDPHEMQQFGAQSGMKPDKGPGGLFGSGVDASQIANFAGQMSQQGAPPEHQMVPRVQMQQMQMPQFAPIQQQPPFDLQRYLAQMRGGY